MNNLRNEIIQMLREDARFSAEKIANVLKVATDEVQSIMNGLENDGVIVKYRAVINRELVEDNFVEALVEIKVSPQRSKGYDNLAETLIHIPEIKNLYLLSGGFDFLMTVEGQSVKEVAFFVNEKLSTLDCVTSTTTLFVLKRYKSEGVILWKDEKEFREMI